MPSTPQQQFEIFRSMLARKQGLDRTTPLFGAVVGWLKLPLNMPELYREEIRTLVCEAFGLSHEDLRSELLRASQNGNVPEEVKHETIARVVDLTSQAVEDEKVLYSLLPSHGYFHDYAMLTRNSEAPLAYHVFCALAGLVATVNRRVFFDMGSFRLYPPLGVLILGPSGIKKTSAADIIVNVLNEMQLTPVYAEKLTPEALVDAMKGGNATGLVYSPEMTVLVSKQRYMESIIPLLTRFMDSPDVWKSETIMRGKGVLTNVSITCLMCSTLDWFIKNTPENIFGGGFIARNIMVLQEQSARIIALPKPTDEKLRAKVIVQLAELHELQGPMTLLSQTYKRHLEWYEDDKRNRISEHEILETYYQRKPSHLLRFAMCLHLATCRDLEICEGCWHRAHSILEWVERFLPSLASRMFKSSWGEDQDLIIRKIRGSGGYITHTDLVRKMQYKMGATQVRGIISSLRESGVVRETRNTVEHSYALTEKVND